MGQGALHRPQSWRMGSPKVHILNPWTRETIEQDRVFIPSKLRDNKFLGPEYVANLQMVGSDTLVRAWLDGDWTVIEGAYFDCWRYEQHVVEPFEVPAHWRGKCLSGALYGGRTSDEEDTGRTGHGMMRQCMRQCMAEDGRMGEGWRKHRMMRHGGMMGPLAMRIIFALMDRDGDGTISLEEFQAAHGQIFKAMDPTKMAPFASGGDARFHAWHDQIFASALGGLLCTGRSTRDRFPRRDEGAVPVLRRVGVGQTTEHIA